MRRPYGNKYGVAPKEARTWEGRTYASKAEMQYAQKLDALVRMGVLASVKPQPTVELGVPENKYRPDFICQTPEGAAYFVDVKGHETAKFKHDKKLWAAYGPAPLHIVKRKGRSFTTVEIIEGGGDTAIAG